MAGEYAFWLASLRGETPDHKRGRAESGYWRKRHADGTIRPYHLWREEGTGRLCMVRDCGRPEYVTDEEAFCESVFCYAVRHPVRSSDYRYYVTHRDWPESSLAQYEQEDKAHKERVRQQRARR